MAFQFFRTQPGTLPRAPAMIEAFRLKRPRELRPRQPYHAGPDATRVLTWVVHELNNTDKHRIIPITTTYCFVGAVRMLPDDGPPVDILPWQEEVREPLHDGMEIARAPLPQVRPVRHSIFPLDST